MSTPTNVKPDPLLRNPAPDRVAFALGMMLGAEDFEAEQTYHRGRLAFALLAACGAGTALGLRVQHRAAVEAGGDPPRQAREEEIVVAPGLAVDGLGRTVEVRRAACIRLQRWYDVQAPGALETARRPEGVVADLFVRFVGCGRGKTPAFRAGALDALDAIADARIRDAYELKLILRAPGEGPPVPGGPALDGLGAGDRVGALRNYLLDRPWPPQVPESETDWIAPRFDPFAVFLARITIGADAPATAGDRPPRRPSAPVTVDETGRPLLLPLDQVARWLRAEGAP